ncbi:MAG: S41 family peptidase, partial [Clostridia bacterium]|nr:S41 family peptidase [Clostridia bacterium]
SVLLVITTAIITFIVTTVLIYNNYMIKRGHSSNHNNIFAQAIDSIVTVTSKINGEDNNAYIDSQLFKIRQKLDELYIGDIDDNKLIEGALEGYVSALGDEYTEYLNESEVKALMEDVNGSYVGVGLYIANNTEKNEILVIGVVADSPASTAGILAGDVVKKIDDMVYTGNDLNNASSKMRGNENTEVKLTVERNGEEIDFNIIRKTIKFKYVESSVLENNIGYIKLNAFEGQCSEDFKKAYNELKEKNIKSLIIDLRNNGGGLVDQALKIAEMVLPKGSKMLITRDKNNNEEVSISEKEPIVDVPIVILVNGGTASASEILTAAISENTGAKVVGTQTYGKGIIQGVFLFDDNKTGIKITMQEYFTPYHNKLHKIGIKPDEVVELPDEWKGHATVDKEFDTQLKKAIEILNKTN